jgi:hypothetical protein
VKPSSGSPVRLGISEAEALTSFPLASLTWDVEKDLLAWLSVDDTADDVEAAVGTALTVAGGVILHLRMLLVRRNKLAEENCSHGREIERGGVERGSRSQ